MKNRILIIEDEEDIRDSLRDILEVEGYDVTVATNGKDAIELLDKITPPDLILVDLMMPIMSGMEFIKHRQLKTDWLDLPIIVMSADHQTEKRAAELGIRGCLKKPLELDDLINLVKESCAS